MSQQPVTHLLNQIQSGDENALLTLHARYANLVFSVAFRVLHDQQSAEEVTQDLFMRLWRKSDLFDPAKGQFTTWLATVTRRLAIDRLRHQQRRTPEAGTLSMDEHPYLWETELIYEDLSELQRTLLSTLDQLSPDQQKAIRLAYFYSMSHSEIADYLDRPLGTIKSHIRQGMEKLRAIWVPDSPAESD